MRPTSSTGGWHRATRPPRVLTVLGGSSPFTLALAQALVADPPWPEGVLRLQGRDGAALEAVSRCAERLLEGSGWSVEATDDLRPSLEGTDVVLHQNRYGGLAWRAEDEVVASQVGLPPDETIGPGGLGAALRTGHGQRRYAAALARHAPARPVLTLTNPLGVSTAVFAADGLDVLGVCELPEMTRQDVASALGVAADAVDAAYAGLNHRGFWHSLRSPRVPDPLEELTARLAAGRASLHGLTPDTVRNLTAVPDKYHALFTRGQFLTPGRAAALDALRTRIQQEAAADPGSLPAALAERDMPWYRVIVVPVLAALAGRPLRAVVTATEADGVAVEHLVDLAGPRLTPVASPAPPPAVQGWLDRFRVHEAATLAAALAPSHEAVAAAVALDPLVPADRVAVAAAAVWAGFERWRDGEG